MVTMTASTFNEILSQGFPTLFICGIGFDGKVNLTTSKLFVGVSEDIGFATSFVTVVHTRENKLSSP
jgi:hypothetical protein